MTSPWPRSQVTATTTSSSPAVSQKLFLGWYFPVLNDLESFPITPSFLGSACTSLALCKYTCMLALACSLFSTVGGTGPFSGIENHTFEFTDAYSNFPCSWLWGFFHPYKETFDMSDTLYSATGVLLMANSFLPVLAEQGRIRWSSSSISYLLCLGIDDCQICEAGENQPTVTHSTNTTQSEEPSVSGVPPY